MEPVTEGTMPKIVPPRPFMTWSLGGLPLEGSGLTFDRHDWYFCSRGWVWQFGVGDRRYRRSGAIVYDGVSAFDVVRRGGGGVWYSTGKWPDIHDHAWKSHLRTHPEHPATFMPINEARRLIVTLMYEYQTRSHP